MFVLGYVYWLFHRDLKSTIDFLRTRFAKKELLRDANIKVLQTGYNYGETVEGAVSLRMAVAPAKMKEGVYRNIMGNQATALGLIAASVKSNLKLFYGSYPITPASDILHELAKHKNFGVITFQAEDEIAAAASAIGASYGGSLGVTGTSGPGLALKSESISLAVSLELPLVVVNVQRAGPSTGMPTKTEQADLLFAMYGRHGESPLPIVAAKSPADCFDAIFEACRIALKHMTPVIFLSDGYIANGAEPWRFPVEEDLEDLHVNFVAANTEGFQPYKRNELLVRNWAIPGTVGAEHRIGGLEKQDITGNISYDPANHEHMVHTRAKKVALIADSIPELQVELGQPSGDVLVLGWGSPYGSIRAAVKELIAEGHSVAHAHLRHINPFPKNLGALMKQFKKVVIPEINSGQLANMIRAQYLHDVVSLTKVQGLPFSKSEIVEKIKEVLP
jgi:2-oxoglutarate ferredoxin oxidoreductase subunit alpha